MRKLFLSAIIIALSLCAHSQSSKDSTTLPNSQLRTALKLIEQGKECGRVLVLTERQVDLLGRQIELKDSIVSNLRGTVFLKSQIIESYKAEVANVDYQNGIYKNQVKALNKSLKRSKTKTFLTAMTGIISTTIITIFLLKK